MKKRSMLMLTFLLAFSFSAFAIDEGTDDPKVVIATPPAPKFTDAERQKELAGRRTEVLRRMKPNSIFIFRSAETRNYAGDVDFYYRQENNLYYLTNLRQNNATLVLIKNGDQGQEFLFLPKRNPQAEVWNGKMYSNEEATKISGMKNILEASELAGFLQAVKDKKPFTAKNGTNLAITAENVYLLMPYGERDSDGNAEFRREGEFGKSLTGYKVENGRSIVEDMRLIKSPYEIKLLQHAVDITTEAQMRSMGMVGRANFEYEVQAEVEYIFRKRNADYWGYPSIVGCGPNATTLHYEEAQSPVKKGELLLMDVGAEYDHYTADVTRTFPVNGKFSKEQSEIYQIVYDAQEAVAKAAKPGASFGDLSNAADEVIKDGLFKLGLITDKNSRQYSLFYMHGFGHWIGMNVHDVGSYSKPMQPGMVFTNEPGIYIREDALDYLPKTPEWQAFVEKVRPNFEKYKNIGVRIEDDLMITSTGVEWMTKALPRKISDIESFMAKAPKEVQIAKFDQQLNPTIETFDVTKNVFSNDSLSFINPQGKTVRRGWVWAGKNANNSDHQHAE